MRGLQRRIGGNKIGRTGCQYDTVRYIGVLSILSYPNLPAILCTSLCSMIRKEIVEKETIPLTSPPERYVPIALVLGPTSNLGRSNRNTLLGSYDALLISVCEKIEWAEEHTLGIDIARDCAS